MLSKDTLQTCGGPGTLFLRQHFAPEFGRCGDYPFVQMDGEGAKDRDFIRRRLVHLPYHPRQMSNIGQSDAVTSKGARMQVDPAELRERIPCAYSGQADHSTPIGLVSEGRMATNGFDQTLDQIGNELCFRARKPGVRTAPEKLNVACTRRTWTIR